DLGGNERGSRAEEWIVDRSAALRVIQDRPAHEFDRFLRRVIALFFLRSAHDELRRGRVPHGGVVASLAEPGRVFLAHVPTRLVLVPVVCTRQDRAALVPNYLLWVQEADS